MISNTRTREYELQKQELLNKIALADLEHQLRDKKRTHEEADESSTVTHKLKIMDKNKAHYCGSNNPAQQLPMIDPNMRLSVEGHSSSSSMPTNYFVQQAQQRIFTPSVGMSQTLQAVPQWQSPNCMQTNSQQLPYAQSTQVQSNQNYSLQQLLQGMHGQQLHVQTPSPMLPLPQNPPQQFWSPEQNGFMVSKL